MKLKGTAAKQIDREVSDSPSVVLAGILPKLRRARRSFGRLSGAAASTEAKRALRYVADVRDLLDGLAADLERR